MVESYLEETMDLFEGESMALRSKIIFIHFNHSNPAMNDKFIKEMNFSGQGYRFARTGDIFPL